MTYDLRGLDVGGLRMSRLDVVVVDASHLDCSSRSASPRSQLPRPQEESTTSHSRVTAVAGPRPCRTLAGAGLPRQEPPERASPCSSVLETRGKELPI